MNWLNSGIIITCIRTVIILIITFGLHKAIKKIFNRPKIKNLIHIKFIKNILIVIIWIFAFIIIASQFSGFNKLVTTILAGSGILAVVIGMAAQESLSNMFSGMFISIFKPFNIGDKIKIVGDDTAGYVEDITLRHTIIRTYTNVRIIIPNSIIGSSKIENSSYSTGASYPIDVTIAYENNEKRMRAIEIMEEVISNHPLFYDRRTEEQKKKGEKPATVLCNQLLDSGINLRILMWTSNIQDNPIACSDCRLEILRRFEEEGIEIPYNKLIIFNRDTKNNMLKQ